MSYLNSFINQLIDFLDSLRVTFPEVIDIRTAHNALNTFGDTASLKYRSLKAFMFCCAPLYEEIFREQEEFFTDINSLEKMQEQEQFQYYAGDDDAEQQAKMMAILQLKDYWSELSESSKDRIWIHMKALLIKGALAVLRMNYEPTEQEKKQWDKMYNHCKDIQVFTKNNKGLFKRKKRN